MLSSNNSDCCWLLVGCEGREEAVTDCASVTGISAKEDQIRSTIFSEPLLDIVPCAS